MTAETGTTVNRTTTNSSASVFEHEGLLWKSKPETTSAFTQLLEARSTLREITKDSLWSPWVREEREEESDAALAVMEQWTRAEPGFRQMTEQEVDEMLAESDRRSAAAHAADVERWERDRQRYDPERESARLALLERSSRLKFVTEELARYGAMDSSRSSGWAWRIAELQQEAEKLPPEIERGNRRWLATPKMLWTLTGVFLGIADRPPSSTINSIESAISASFGNGCRHSERS